MKKICETCKITTKFRTTVAQHQEMDGRPELTEKGWTEVRAFVDLKKGIYKEVREVVRACREHCPYELERMIENGK